LFFFLKELVFVVAKKRELCRLLIVLSKKKKEAIAEKKPPRIAGTEVAIMTSYLFCITKKLVNKPSFIAFNIKAIEKNMNVESQE
jgi:hypothetical protein